MLAAVLIAAVALLAAGTAAAATRAPERLTTVSWPARWRVWPEFTKRPPPALERAIDAAAGNDLVLKRLLLALARRESRFNLRIRGYAHGGTPPAGLSAKQLKPYQAYAASYARHRGQRIAGSATTWGQRFQPTDWRPYGALQINPVHIWGPIVPASAPLTAAYDADTIAKAGARLLRQWRAETGSYAAAVANRWNRSPSWATDVFTNYVDLGGQLSELQAANA